MTNRTEKGAFITLDFSGTEKRFADIYELREFMQSQRDDWLWLEVAAWKDDNLKQVWEPFGRVFRQINPFIASYETNLRHRFPNTGLIKNFRKQAQAAIDQGFILAEAPNAHFILDLKDKRSPQIAGYALDFLNKTVANNPAAREGAYWGMQHFQRPIRDPVETRQKSLSAIESALLDRFEKQHKDIEENNEQLIKGTTELQEKPDLLAKKAVEQATRRLKVIERQMTKQARAFENQAVELTGDFENKVTEQTRIFENRTIRQETAFENQRVKQANVFERQTTEQANVFERQTTEQANVFERQIDKQASDSEKQITKQAEDFEIMLNEAKKKLTDFETTFRENIALQSPVAYWTQKRDHHQKVMWWMAASTAIFAIATGLIFIWAANVYLNVTFDEVKLSQIGVLLAISTLGVWLTRLSAKIFISNLHLRTDADERVTMIQTYLAFLAEGNGPKVDERQLILQTLFRPSTTGFIKDDGPTTPFNTLAPKTTSKKE